MGVRCHIDTHRFRIVLLIVFTIISSVAWTGVCAGDLDFSGFSESQLNKIKNGEILVRIRQTGDPPKGMVEAAIMIEAPVETIWQTMLDCGELPTFIPGMKTCQLLDSGPNWELIRHEIKWIWFLPRFVYVFRADYEPNRTIDFVRIEGDLREMKGSWRMASLDRNRRTLLYYCVYLDPGFFIPQWLVRRTLKADLPAMMTAIREKVLSSCEEP